MKILFLTPPALDGKPAPERVFGCNYGIYPLPNLFLLYPATMLRNAGHQVEILDYPAQGRTVDQFHRDMIERRDDLVVFSTVFLSKTTDFRARDVIRKASPGTRFLFVSTEPTASPAPFLAADSWVIRGEPELVIVPFAEHLANTGDPSQLPGVSSLSTGDVPAGHITPVVENLDALPFPDRTLLPTENYFNPKLGIQPFTIALASRGCSFGCYYCVPNALSFAREIEHKRNHRCKPPVRLHGTDRVIEECRRLASEGYKAVSFVDDQFVWGVERTQRICEGIAPLGLTWSCLARADMLQDPEMVRAMARAGCKYIDIGVESFDQRILDRIGKGLEISHIYLAVENLKSAGIEPEINLLLGSCPLETGRTIRHSFRKLLELDVDYVLFSACTPFPHTEFHRIARERGWMIEPEYRPIDPIKQSFISYPHLAAKRIEKLLRFMYLFFYYRPSYIIRRLVRLTSWSDFLTKARAALTILIR